MININFKSGVQTCNPALRVGISPLILQAIVATADIYNTYGSTLTVTSIFDGKHMNGSKHYLGHAFDCRIYDLSAKQLQSICLALKQSLTGFDVVLEKDHIHIEIH